MSILTRFVLLYQEDKKRGENLETAALKARIAMLEEETARLERQACANFLADLQNVDPLSEVISDANSSGVKLPYYVFFVSVSG